MKHTEPYAMLSRKTYTVYSKENIKKADSHLDASAKHYRSFSIFPYFERQKKTHRTSSYKKKRETSLIPV